MPVAKIKEATEGGDKHRRIGLFVETRAGSGHHFCRIVVKSGVGAEERLGHGHDQRRSDPLARHVADAEVESIVGPEKIVEIAAHLFGWTDVGPNGESRLRRKIDSAGRQHAHLDLAGQAQ